MYIKFFFNFSILSLLALVKINCQVIGNNTYTGKCNDIYKCMEGQGKINNFYDCKTNNKGEVTELRVYPYCLKNKQLETRGITEYEKDKTKYQELPSTYNILDLLLHHQKYKTFGKFIIILYTFWNSCNEN